MFSLCSLQLLDLLFKIIFPFFCFVCCSLFGPYSGHWISAKFNIFSKKFFFKFIHLSLNEFFEELTPPTGFHFCVCLFFWTGKKRKFWIIISIIYDDLVAHNPGAMSILLYIKTLYGNLILGKTWTISLLCFNLRQPYFKTIIMYNGPYLSRQNRNQLLWDKTIVLST